MKRVLDRAFDPPAPVVSAVVRARSGGAGVPVEALVDTGADVCAVPRGVLEVLEAVPVGSVRVSGSAGSREAPLYRLNVEVAGVAFKAVRAIESLRSVALIGRNVTRELVLLVDGPKERLELRPPRPSATTGS